MIGFYIMLVAGFLLFLLFLAYLFIWMSKYRAYRQREERRFLSSSGLSSPLTSGQRSPVVGDEQKCGHTQDIVLPVLPHPHGEISPTSNNT